MLTCREVTELVSDYIEGRLGLLDRLRFRWHLRGCDACHEYVRQMRLTRDALGGLRDSVAVPDHVRDELLRRFRAWKKG